MHNRYPAVPSYAYFCVISAPIQPVVEYAGNGYAIWSVTESQSRDSTFEIRYNQSDSEAFETVTINNTLLAYVLTNLETDTTYTIQARIYKYFTCIIVNCFDSRFVRFWAIQLETGAFHFCFKQLVLP